MPTVAELTAVYGNFLLSPRPGPGVCDRCFNLIKSDEPHGRCWGCRHAGDHLALVAPISYSVGGEQLHHALASYKRLRGNAAERLTVELAAIVWRHLALHEPCLATAAGLQSDRFELVATVPSSDSERDRRHPLHRIAGNLSGPTRERYAPLLTRTEHPVMRHAYSADKYVATRPLDGASVLLIDDTWTTGANAQSAAGALKAAGAGTIGALVIGRHVNRAYGDNDRRLRARGRALFDWSRCAFCAAD